VAPTYQYSFDFAPGALGAAHAAEIAFVFSNATASANARPGARAVEDAMSEAWIAFAKTGNPNHAGMPMWPTYDTATRAVMVFDATTAVANDPRASERKVWIGKAPVR
jgi:para-nitrobenzyl esterase